MKKMPLFYLCGTEGVGKSSIAKELIARNNDTYVVLSGEISNEPASPEQIGAVKRMWNDICFDFSKQSGRSVILYNDSYITDTGLTEEQLDDTHFITLFCEESVLRQRFCKKWGDDANKKVGSNMTLLDLAIIRNKYYKEYYEEQNYKNMVLIDTTNMTVSEVAKQVFAYVQKQINEIK